MKITELRNRFVKLSPRSITVKDEYAKTRAVIKALRFKELPPRDAMPLWKALKDSGLWNSGEMDAVYVVSGQLYYLYNQSADEYYLHNRHDTAWKDTILADMTRGYEARQNLIAKAKDQGITVIPCTVLH